MLCRRVIFKEVFKMAIFLNVLLLLVGFVLLIKGADFFVDGAASLARKLKIPSLVVGLTIVAMGTSSPELAVSISSSLSGANSMAVSNVVGSNIFNLLIVVGVCALIAPVGITKDILKRDYPVSIAAMLIFLVMLLIGNETGGELDLIESIILFALMIGYTAWTIVAALKERKNAQEDEQEKPFVWWKCALFIVGGVAAIIFGGDMVVDNASALGAAIGMSETLIGLTICAVGTSLPELVTSISASRRGETDIAMGNVIGSNIFNVLGILGISGIIKPIDVTLLADGTQDLAILTNTLVDCGVYIGVAILAYIFCLTSKKVTRAEGGVLVACYVAYMAYAIIRDVVLV